MVNCFEHLAHFSRLPMGGLESPDLFNPSDFDKEVYSSPSSSKSSSLSSHCFALFFAVAFCFSKTAFDTLRFLPTGASPSLSRWSESGGTCPHCKRGERRSVGYKDTHISGGRACTFTLFSADDRILIPIS